MSIRGSLICRGCSEPLPSTVLSLGNQPLSNKLPRLNTPTPDPVFPLEFRVCSKCSLGQIGEYVSPFDIFNEYTYFSSTSASWLEHAKSFAQETTRQLELGVGDLVIEVASNDGYLLQYFQELDCQVLGIEPAQNVAFAANEKGINTEVSFFGKKVAHELIQRKLIPKLVVCNNVMAHVPDLSDFLTGLALLIQKGAVVSVEAPSMLVMLRDNLFDTIYHEHFSYLSATSVNFLASQHNIRLIDIEEISTHGGSYRFWLGSVDSEESPSVAKILVKEEEFGILDHSVHSEFAEKSKKAIADFTLWCRNQKKPLIGYGAAAKATVLLNASGISVNEIVAIADNSPSKQNRMVPGVRIPILRAKDVFLRSQGNLVIFPWNIAIEIAAQIRVEFPNYIGEVWIPLPGMKKLAN